jgi:hypothetical protein
MTTGRNDPCPCGSGKKYKNCHLRADESASFSNADRAAAFHVRDKDLTERIVRFARREFGARWLDGCIAALGIDPTKIGESDLQLVVPLSLYHLREQGHLPVELFMERNRGGITPDDLALLDAQRQAWFSVWEVRSVERGVSLSIEDLLTGETRFVLEKSGSNALVNRDAILARIVDFEGLSLIAGCHPQPLPPEFAAAWTKDVRKICRFGRGTVPAEKLRDAGVVVRLVAAWNAAARALDERPLPTLANTDGDPLLLTTDKYGIVPGKRDEVESMLAGIEGVQIDEEKRGTTRYTFTRPGNKKLKRWENTIVGFAEVSRSALRIETNSIRRADALRKRIEDACGDIIEHKGRVHSDPKALIGKEPSKGSTRDETPPELLAHLVKMKQQHMLDWMDESVPALGGLTPRQAASDSKARPKLEVLLKAFENHEARLPAAERITFDEVRRALGLDSPAGPR